MINSNGDNLWTYFYGDQRKDWANSMAKNPGGFIGVSANKLMDEGNRRPNFFSIDKTGTVQFNELQTGPQDIEAHYIQYNSTFNSYNISIEYNDETYVSSGIWHFNLPFVYVCSGVIDGLGDSQTGEVTVNYDGGFTGVGTAYFLTPGQSSIFLMKMTPFCERSNNNLLSIENSGKDEIIIYPNPANDVVILNESISEIVSITSVAGQAVPLIFDQKNISTKHLNNGTYFLSYKNKSLSLLIKEFIKCNIEKVLHLQDGFLICTNCGDSEYVILDSDKPNYKNPIIENKLNGYKRMNHFSELLNQFQGKESTEIVAVLMGMQPVSIFKI
jgi:hypothetical protein